MADADEQPGARLARRLSAVRGALNEFVAEATDLCHSKLKRMAWRIVGDEASAEDAIQDAVLTCTTHAMSIKGQPWAWLKQTLFRICLAMKTERGRLPRAQGDDVFPEPEGKAPGPATAAEDKDAVAFAFDAAGLTAVEARVLRLHYVEAQSLTEIAGLFDLTPARVGQLRQSAIAKLNRRLGDGGGREA